MYSINLGHFSGIFEDTAYTCDLLEGTVKKDDLLKGIVQKDWADVDPYKVSKPPKWCSKIWFLLHIE